MVKTIQLTQGKVAIVDDDDFEIEKINNDGGIIGELHPDGYIIISMEDNK